MKKLLMLLILISCGGGGDGPSSAGATSCSSFYGEIYYNEVSELAFEIIDNDNVFVAWIYDTNVNCYYLENGLPVIVGTTSTGLTNFTSNSVVTNGGSLCSTITEEVSYTKNCKSLTLCDSTGCLEYQLLE